MTYLISAVEIPRAILSWNENGRKSFLHSIEKGEEKIFHSRWMILGCAQVGKTTLLKKLQDLPLNEVLNTKPTVGVEIHSQIFHVEDDNLKGKDLELNLRFIKIVLIENSHDIKLKGRT